MSPVVTRAAAVLAIGTVLALGASVRSGAASAVQPAPVGFLKEVAPVLLKRCAGCHGERSNLGGYRLHAFQDLMRKGGGGRPAVTPGKPEASELLRRIEIRDPALRMPKQDEPLSPSQTALIRRWILEGARFDGGDPTAPYRAQLGPREHPAAPLTYRAAVPALATAVAPDSGDLAVSGYHEVTVWDAQSGRLKRRIGRLPQRIQSLAFSPDGRTLLVAGGTPGEYGEAALVDWSSGRRTRVLEFGSEIILTAAFSPDGRKVATGGADNTVRVTEVETGKRLWQNRVHADWVTSLGFSADGEFVASAGKDLTVKIYRATDGALFATYLGHNRQIGQFKGQHPVYALRFSPEGRQAYSAGGGRWVQVWDPIKTRDEAGDAGDMEERFAKQGHARYIEHGFKKDVYALAVSRTTIFAASSGGEVKQFNLTDLKEVRSFPCEPDWIYSLTLDEPRRRLIAGSYTGLIQVWDVESGKRLSEFSARPGASLAAR